MTRFLFLAALVATAFNSACAKSASGCNEHKSNNDWSMLLYKGKNCSPSPPTTLSGNISLPIPGYQTECVNVPAAMNDKVGSFMFTASNNYLISLFKDAGCKTHFKDATHLRSWAVHYAASDYVGLSSFEITLQGE
ncbi:hypothetical protein BJ138DRAFT_1150384 [Hygrophoropsis aurantiaca]|uniref:Uncharacterized protein n=1 Tax=Hygrophoropsis aurantiaca TaxID=72124 RepID=A0ACB8ADG0_9AGAM|nr:hypothetical protein BJ138DRAFT_1150384 [Hygrophoropsis aurantiaca]